jgi:hypothetical protein
MLGKSRVATQLVASRVVLSSIELGQLCPSDADFLTAVWTLKRSCKSATIQLNCSTVIIIVILTIDIITVFVAVTPTLRHKNRKTSFIVPSSSDGMEICFQNVPQTPTGIVSPREEL